MSILVSRIKPSGSMFKVIGSTGKPVSISIISSPTRKGAPSNGEIIGPLLGPPISNSPPMNGSSVIKTSLGSINQVPASPLLAPALGMVFNCKPIRPEVSIKPPSPDSEPPLAVNSPLIRALFSANKITVPPSPLVPPSALIEAFSSR